MMLTRWLWGLNSRRKIVKKNVKLGVENWPMKKIFRIFCVFFFNIFSSRCA